MKEQPPISQTDSWISPSKRVSHIKHFDLVVRVTLPCEHVVQLLRYMELRWNFRIKREKLVSRESKHFFDPEKLWTILNGWQFLMTLLASSWLLQDFKSLKNFSISKKKISRFHLWVIIKMRLICIFIGLRRFLGRLNLLESEIAENALSTNPHNSQTISLKSLRLSSVNFFCNFHLE